MMAYEDLFTEFWSYIDDQDNPCMHTMLLAESHVETSRIIEDTIRDIRVLLRRDYLMGDEPSLEEMMDFSNMRNHFNKSRCDLLKRTAEMMQYIASEE